MQTVTPLSIIVEYFATCFDAESSMKSSLFSFMNDTDKLKNFSAAQNVGDIKQRSVHIFIEEPELSLYPESQKALVDFLVRRCFHTQKGYDMTLMMATHSPYIVNYLNLLIKRNDKGEDTTYNNHKSRNLNILIHADLHGKFFTYFIRISCLFLKRNRVHASVREVLNRKRPRSTGRRSSCMAQLPCLVPRYAACAE